MSIPPPHGGRLVDRIVRGPKAERRSEEARELPRIAPFIDQVYDAEKIATGAYSPLEGFMGLAELETVTERGRLPDDTPWPMPIVLAPAGRANASVAESASRGDAVALLDGGGSPFALLSVEERFEFDRTAIARAAFGTTDPAHPNVADMLASGETGLAGKLEVFRIPPSAAGEYELTPAETRTEFARRRWQRVAAYQCRNPPHTAHEYLQRTTLDREDVDGLFVQPVVGRLKKGDYRPSVILESYRALLDAYYPKERVLLASLSVTMRYAGPKGALFYAIVRKNFGCGLYIVGRDQAGVARFYDPYACHRIFDEFDIGVTPLRYLETFYCRRCAGMATPKTCSHPDSERIDTSQTRIRQALAEGRPPPPEILRPEVYAILSKGDVILTE